MGRKEGHSRKYLERKYIIEDFIERSHGDEPRDVRVSLNRRFGSGVTKVFGFG